MYDAVTSGPNNCANLGLSQLNQENNAKAASFDTPNPPKTLKQAIAQIVFDTYATKHHEALSPSDIDVRFELSPQGLLNPFHNDLVKARTTTNNEQVQFQSPASYPPCRSSRTPTGTRNHGKQRLSMSSTPAAKRSNLSKSKGIARAFRPESIARGPDSGDLNFVVVPQKAWISRQYPVRSI